MGNLARLKSLRVVEAPPNDLTVVDDGGAFARPPIVRLAPVPRGVVAPVSGHMSDPQILRALMASGDGWLNVDGRLVANGTRWAEDALTSLPEMAAVLARIATFDAESLARSRNSYRAALADHEASGAPIEDFYFDANLSDTYCKETETQRAIAKAGWAQIMLRRKDGIRTVLCDSYGVDDGQIAEHLEALRRSLGFDPRPGHNYGPSMGPADEPGSNFRL